MQKKIENDAIQNNQIFLDYSFSDEQNSLLDLFNSKNTGKYENRSILKYKNFYYYKEFEQLSVEVISKILNFNQEHTSKIYNNLLPNIDDFIEKHNIDDEEKKKALKRCFANNNIFFVYGEAGSGKSTFINYIVELFKDYGITCITKTHSALSNLKFKINCNRIEYFTADSYLTKNTPFTTLLIIDEAEVISTKEIKEIFEKKEFDYLLVVGDYQQLESISFGGWFYLVKDFLEDNQKCEFNCNYRTNCNALKELANELRVKPKYEKLKVILNKNIISNNFNISYFDSRYDDTIILALSYNGFYGINNLNKLMQAKNQNKGVLLNGFTYKVGDPILFIDNNDYKDVFYNNLKGKIEDINEHEKDVDFKIKITDKYYSNNFVPNYNLDNMINFENKNDTFYFTLKIQKHTENDEDNENNKNFNIPFVVAYATSIHKAQGLEYDCVKIVINDDIDININRNILYTAVTRAKKDLTIFWSKDVEEKIITQIINEKNTYARDVNLLKEKYFKNKHK